MATYGNESLRKENIDAVFYAVVEGKCATRTEISKYTGISVVTVGKAVEEFLDRNVFIQRASQKKTVGRHANRVTLNKTKQFAVIDISNKNFRATCFDLSFNVTHRYRYDYLDDFDYADNLRAFLNRLKAYMIDKKQNNYFANYFIVPGVYDKHNDRVINCDNIELENMHIQAYVQKRAAMTMNRVTDKITAAAKHCQVLCPKGENILYIWLQGREALKARIVVDGRVLKVPFVNEIKLDHDNIHCSISKFISDICCVVDLSQVYIESDRRLYDQDMFKIKMAWRDNKWANNIEIPQLILNHDIEFAHLGCAEMLRRVWLDNLIR